MPLPSVARSPFERGRTESLPSYHSGFPKSDVDVGVRGEGGDGGRVMRGRRNACGEA